MTAVNHAELKRVAEGAIASLNSGLPVKEIEKAAVAFDMAANPAVVLALLSEIEGLKAERDSLKLAICGGEDVPGAINAVSVEDCERFIAEERSRNDWCAEKEEELDALRTQAPDSWRPEADELLCRWLGQSCDDDGVSELQAATRAFIKTLRPQTAESGK